MRRRDFVRATAAPLLYLAAVGPTRAARPIVLRLANVSTRNTPLGLAAQAFAKTVETGGGGRMRVDIHPASQLGGERENVQDIRLGVLDLTIATSGGFGAVDPTLGVFDIPFLFRDAAHAHAVLDGGIGRQALERLEPHGLIGLAWAESGFRQITTAKAPVRRPEDLRGVKIRTPQSDAIIAMFKALGAEPRAIALPELHAALNAGQVEAQELPVALALAGGVDSIQKFLSLTSHIYSTAAILIGRRVFEALSPDDRAIVRQAAQDGAIASRQASAQTEKAAIEEFRRRGVTLIEDVDRAAFAEALKPLDREFEPRFGAERIAAIRAYRS